MNGGNGRFNSKPNNSMAGQQQAHSAPSGTTVSKLPDSPCTRVQLTRQQLTLWHTMLIFCNNALRVHTLGALVIVGNIFITCPYREPSGGQSNKSSSRVIIILL